MSRKHEISLLGYGLVLLSALLFGTYGVWSRLMGDTFEPFYQAWARSLIVVLIMLPLMIRAKSFRKLERKDWPHLSFFIIFCIFTQVPLYYAFNNAPIGAVQLIFYAAFVITAYVVGRMYLGEQITKIKLLSLVLAFAGLAVVFGASVLAFAPLGLALAAFNGVASGGEVSSSKKMSDKYSPALLVFYGWLFTLLTHLPLSLLIGETQHMPELSIEWLWLLIYALVNTVAFWLVITGFRHIDASIGGLIGLSEVIFGILFGALVFNESLTWSIYVGGALIIFAAMLPDLMNVIKGKATKTAEEPVREL